LKPFWDGEQAVVANDEEADSGPADPVLDDVRVREANGRSRTTERR